MKAGFFIVVGLVSGLAVGYFLWKVPSVIPTPQIVRIIDTVPEPYAVYYPKVVYKDTGSHTILIDSVPFPVPFALPVDTQSIIRDYLAVRRYKIDTILEEVKLNMNMDIYANRILKYDISLTNERICKNITNNGFKMGLMVGYQEISPLIGYQYNKFTYLGGYNIYNKGFRIGTLYNF